MIRSYDNDMEKSKKFYIENKKYIEKIYNDTSKLYNIEFEQTEISKILDQYCGIDYLLFYEQKVYGVASRINFNKNHYNSVTIRYKRKNKTKTEFEKRVESIKNKNGQMYASITMQIDAENNKIKNAIVFESDKLYLIIDQNLSMFEKKYMQTNNIDGNLFFKLSYENIEKLSKQYNFNCKKYIINT